MTSKKLLLALAALTLTACEEENHPQPGPASMECVKHHMIRECAATIRMECVTNNGDPEWCMR